VGRTATIAGADLIDAQEAQSGVVLEPTFQGARRPAYNNGKLHGTWIDAQDGEDAIEQAKLIIDEYYDDINPPSDMKKHHDISVAHLYEVYDHKELPLPEWREQRKIELFKEQEREAEAKERAEYEKLKKKYGQ